MSTLTITLVASVIAYLIGRYFRSAKINELQSLNEALKIQNTELLHQISNLATVKIVANKDKHPAANDNYLYIEGEINGNREAGLLRLKQWDQAKETLLKNPEDKPL